MENKNENSLEIFPWNENFETGIEEIDNQHKVLVDLLNKLANALTHVHTYKIEKIFDELAKYAEYHFYCEELIWQRYLADPILENKHKETHDSFLPKILEIKEKNKDLDFHRNVEEILVFLINWLAFHIIDEDKRYSIIMNEMKNGKNLKDAIYETDVVMGGSMKELMNTILKMYNTLSIKAIDLIREKQARLRAEKELKKVNKKLIQLSITDQLTNLYNRRHFENVFNRDLKDCVRNKKYIGIILLDIDYFKKLNDTYGHQFGDSALKAVSKCLRKECKRPTDYPFRVGGEEFCILIKSDKEDEVKQLASIIKDKINELKIENKNSLVSDYLTISAGTVSVIPTSKDSIDSIMAIADENLYQAKESGRNTIV